MGAEESEREIEDRLLPRFRNSDKMETVNNRCRLDGMAVSYDKLWKMLIDKKL